MRKYDSDMPIYDPLQTRHMNNGGWYWIDKAIIRQYAAKVGPIGIAVYNYLASLANAEQTCFPSQQRIAQVLGLSRTTVIKAIQTLERQRLIAVDKSVRYPHLYRLLSVSSIAFATEVSKTRQSSVQHVDTNKKI